MSGAHAFAAGAICAVALVALATGSPSVAQTVPPAAPATATAPTAPTAQQRIEQERVMADYARCMVASSWLERETRAFLAIAPNSEAAETSMRHLASGRGRCLPDTARRMRYTPDLFRPAAYAALYVKHFSAVAPADLSTAPDLDFAAEYPGVAAPLTEMQLAFRGFGDCVARGNTADSHYVLLTTLGSVEERDAFARLSPVMGRCVGASTQLRFSRNILRGLIAEALFKLRAVAEPTLAAQD